MNLNKNSKSLFITLDTFALRQFENPNSSCFFDYNVNEFVLQINKFYDENNYQLVDGYAPFCKHIFIPNFTQTKLGDIEINNSNMHLLQTGYQSRTPSELPVLCRWFSKDTVNVPIAKYLDIILYSREQINLENMAKGENHSKEDSPWGIVSIKSQDVNYELPMQPMTMMRNALGKAEGGSGVSINRELYLKSVEYWNSHASVV